MKKLLMLVAAVFALGGDFEDGIKAYESSNLAVARDKFVSACDTNDAQACVRAGALYQLGKDILPDPKKALELCRRMTSPQAGAPTMPVPTDSSSLSNVPTLREFS